MNGHAYGIIVAGMTNSVFDDVEIRNCSSAGLSTVENSNSKGNLFHGGLVFTASIYGSGVVLEPTADNWTFSGTTIMAEPSALYGSGGIGVEVESSGFTCVGCNISKWHIGLAAGLGKVVHGLNISGGSFAENSYLGIRIGTAYNGSQSKVHGLSIHGASIKGITSINGQAEFCIDLEQVDGFDISGNELISCPHISIHAVADSTQPGAFAGADNGVIGPNDIETTGPYLLEGRNITLIAPACNTSASPAQCGFAGTGTVALPAGSSSIVVDTTFATAFSRITVSDDMTIGGLYDSPVTCNTVGGRTYSVTSKVPGKSFTITASAAPAGNPACLTFHMEN
jgi:hypothetical protein